MESIVDMDSWPRAGQFRMFRTFERPQYATTARIDVTALMARKAEGISVYRGCLYGIGAGIHAVPELCMRFRGDVVVRHDAVLMSMTVPTKAGAFNFGYVPFDVDFARFDAQAVRLIAAAAEGEMEPHKAGDRVAYMSCMPWLDYTAINNAMPGPEDCIPRISWGKIVPKGDRWDMAMTIEVHHALVDGAQVGAYFAAVQETMDGFGR